MKLNRSILIIFLLSLVAAAIYRLIPDKPEGFAPQMAMALLGGAIIKDKKWAFILPVLSLFISDLAFHFTVPGWSYQQTWVFMTASGLFTLHLF